MRYEYHVIPAPEKGVKAKGARSTEARYAAALTEVLNTQAAEGWDFVRAEILPSTERQGLTGSKTTYVNLLVFRRVATEGTPQDPPSLTGEALRLIEQESPD